MSKRELEKVSGGVPAWMAEMRAAMFDAVTPADIRAIMQKQVEKAKSGDPAATKLVLEYITGANRKIEAVQHNYYDGPPPREPIDPTDAPPKSPAKLEVMRKRVLNGESTHHAADRRF